MSAPKNILKIIVSNKTSLGDNPALPPEMEDNFLVLLINRHYDKLSSLLETDSVEELGEIFNNTLSECINIESNNKEALEKLCSDIIGEMFNIPSDTIMIGMELVNKVDSKQERIVPESSESYFFNDIDEIKSLTDEIYKRRFLNAVILGAATDCTERINQYQDKLSKIDDRLPSLYYKLLILNDLLIYHTKESYKSRYKDGGRVDVYLSSDGTPVQIKAQGIVFPVLLEETIRGLLELSISHGLPSNRTHAEYIMGKADFKLAEIWDQRLGLPIWRRIRKAIEDVGKDPFEVGINFILMELSEMSVEHFNIAMQEILVSTKEGKNVMKQIVDNILYQKEQDDFQDYMDSQNVEEKFPINDNEDFTSDELISDDLCCTNIMDEL